MTVTAANDSFTYKSPRGDIERPADLVGVVNADGTALAGSNTAPVVQRDALMATNDLTLFTAAISSATTTALVAAVSGQTTRVHRVTLNVSGADVLTFKRGSTQLREPLNFTGAGFMVLDFSSRPWMVTAANEALNLTTSTTATVNVTVEYVTSA